MPLDVEVLRRAAEEVNAQLRDNFFDRPLEERRVELEHRLAQALAARKAKGK
jgi:hypothetical protein